MGHTHSGFHNTLSLTLRCQWALHLSSDDELGKQVVTHSWPKAASHKKWSNCTYRTQQLLESNGTSLARVSSGNLKLVKTLTGENCSAYFRIMLEKNPTCFSQHRECCAYLWKDSSHLGSRNSPLVAVSHCCHFPSASGLSPSKKTSAYSEQSQLLVSPKHAQEIQS